MFARLRDNWVYGGALAAVMLLAVTPVLAQDWPVALLLIWLQLPAYMLHQYEEHDDDRFRRHVNETIGGGHDILTRWDTFIINIAGVWAIDALAFVLAAEVDLGLGLIAVYLSLVNGLAHVLPALVQRRYNPGLVTSILLFMPLGAVTLWVFQGIAEIVLADHAIGLAVSVGIHGLLVGRTLTRRSRIKRAV